MTTETVETLQAQVDGYTEDLAAATAREALLVRDPAGPRFQAGLIVREVPMSKPRLGVATEVSRRRTWVVTEPAQGGGFLVARECSTAAEAELVAAGMQRDADLDSQDPSAVDVEGE